MSDEELKQLQKELETKRKRCKKLTAEQQRRQRRDVSRSFRDQRHFEFWKKALQAANQVRIRAASDLMGEILKGTGVPNRQNRQNRTHSYGLRSLSVRRVKTRPLAAALRTSEIPEHKRRGSM